MVYTISLFAGIAVLLLIALLLNKQLKLSLALKLQSFVAALGIALVSALAYFLFPLAITAGIGMVLLLLVSLILASRLEREHASVPFEWALPAMNLSIDETASTQEAKTVETNEVEEEPVIKRRQPLIEVEADESEELITGRRRRIQEKEELEEQ